MASSFCDASVLCLSFSDVVLLSRALPEMEAKPYRVCIGGRAAALIGEVVASGDNVTLCRGAVSDAIDAVEIAARQRKVG